MSWLPVVTIHGTRRRDRLGLGEELSPRPGRRTAVGLLAVAGGVGVADVARRADGTTGSGPGSTGRWRARGSSTPWSPKAVKTNFAGPLRARCGRCPAWRSGAGRPGRSPRGRRRSSRWCRGAARPARRADRTGRPPRRLSLSAGVCSGRTSASILPAQLPRARGPTRRYGCRTANGHLPGDPHLRLRVGAEGQMAAEGGHQRSRPPCPVAGGPASAACATARPWRRRTRQPPSRPAPRAGRRGATAQHPRRESLRADTRAAPPCSSAREPLRNAEPWCVHASAICHAGPVDCATSGTCGLNGWPSGWADRVRMADG